MLRRRGHNRLVWFSWSVGLSGFRLVRQSVGQLASVSQSVNQSVSQSISLSVNKPVGWSVGRLVGWSQFVGQSVNLLVCQSFNQFLI